MSTNTGTVKFYNAEKGFGFITPDGGGKDVFVHRNNLKGDIKDGDKVTFNTENTPKGPSAIEVSVVD